MAKFQPVSHEMFAHCSNACSRHLFPPQQPFTMLLRTQSHYYSNYMINAIDVTIVSGKIHVGEVILSDVSVIANNKKIRPAFYVTNNAAGQPMTVGRKVSIECRLTCGASSGLLGFPDLNCFAPADLCPLIDLGPEAQKVYYWCSTATAQAIQVIFPFEFNDSLMQFKQRNLRHFDTPSFLASPQNPGFATCCQTDSCRLNM